MARKSLKTVATELDIPVTRAVRLVRQMGFEEATAGTRFQSPMLERICFFLVQLGNADAHANRAQGPGQDSINTVLARHRADLLGLPGVRGVGIGGSRRGEEFVWVYSELPPERLPKVPSHLSGYPVRVKYTGRIAAGTD